MTIVPKWTGQSLRHSVAMWRHPPSGFYPGTSETALFSSDPIVVLALWIAVSIG